MLANPLIQRLKSGTRSLRFLMASSSILVLGMAFGVADTVNYAMTSDQVREVAMRNYTRANYLLGYLLDGWLMEMRVSMQRIAGESAFRKLDITKMSLAFQDIGRDFPQRRIDIRARDGTSIMGSGKSEMSIPDALILSSPAFQSALRGSWSLDLLNQAGRRNSCLLAAQPVYAPAAVPGRDVPLAVLTFCMPYYVFPGFSKSHRELEKLDDKAFTLYTPLHTISMTEGKYKGAEVIAVTKSGRVFFPFSTINNSVSSQSPEAIAAGPWGPFVRFGLSDVREDKVGTIRENGRRFQVVKHHISGRQLALVTIVNYGASPQSRILTSYLANLATILMMAALIYFLSGLLVRPIQRASKAIRRISKGDFTAQIDASRQDEIGELYCDINATGALLSSYVASQKHLAAAEQQLATAQQIQQSFLIKTLPCSRSFDLAAEFHPAYEIGADWYDSLRIGRFLYVIVADVCDKGVPSALFMSVFRTLLRSNILSEAHDGPVDQPVDLGHVVWQVNEYMAANHGDTCMFATVFVASYDSDTGQLCYVNAGHELPQILRDLDGEARLEGLIQTGPAVGVFPGALFRSGATTLGPGDLLFTYTDGLTDARSTQGEGWGFQRLQDFLLQLQANARQPEAVLKQVLAAIERHQGAADRFDDLTVLILRIKACPFPAQSPPLPG